MTEKLNIKSKSECTFDEISLGEVMLRMDPNDMRIRNTRSFRVWEGGGEYNVARALRKSFGLQTGVITAFPDNEVGHLVEDLILQGGVDTSMIRWVPYDGTGIHSRVGLNFTERGFGIRGGIGVSDRGHTAISELKPGEIDWEYLFGKLGVRWFHTGGIYAALSSNAPLVIEEAMNAAKKHGTIISYDLNYRASLAKSAGGKKICQDINRKLAQYVDVMIGNKVDYTDGLGLEVDGDAEDLSDRQMQGLKTMTEQVIQEFPNLKVCATTLQALRSASMNDWTAICWYNGEIKQAIEIHDLAIYDCVGAGDCFAAGLVYGFLTENDAQKALDYGVGIGSLAMTTPGDTSMATLPEIERVIAGGSARVVR